MAAFVYSDITESGINLKAKGEAGKEIRFTAISIGDGFLPEGQDIHTMTALVNQIMRLEVTGITLIGNGEVEVRAPFTNAELTLGFSYRELGLWARDPDTGEERLYACANAGDKAEWIEASGGITVVEKIIRVITITGRAANVVAQLNSGIYITSADLDAHNLSPESHPDLRQELSKKADNERGSWTPRLTGSERAGEHRYEVQIGEYHITGGEVTLHFYLRTSHLDEAMKGDLTISGIPFPCGQVRAAGSILYLSGIGGMPYPVPMLGITEQAVQLRLACSSGERTSVVTSEYITLDSITVQGSIRYSLEV